MGKRIKTCFFGLLMILCAIPLFSVKSMAKDELTISQVDAYLPDIDVYLDNADGEENFSPQLPNTGTTLSAEAQKRFGDTGRGIFYHVLLDVSNSVSEEQLEAMKASIISLSEQLRDIDQLEVVTFSDKVKVILKGGESAKEVKDVLTKVKRERKTRLFEGINKLSDSVAGQRKKVITEGLTEKEILRNVGVILTDWQEIKDAGGVTSREESLKKLQKTGTPLYGFCLKTAKVSLQDDMGAFLRETGGSFHLFDQNKKTQLTDLNKKLLDQTLLTVHASSNKTSEDEKILELVNGDNVIKKEHIYLNLARKDETKPSILKVEQKGKDAKTLIVTFSEDVLRADNKNNYSILKNGRKHYTVSEATYTAKDDNYQAKLILNDNLVRGDYELSLVNVTDNTNEENELTDSWSGHLEGEGKLKAFYSWLGQFWGLLLLLATLVILFIIYMYIKKHRGIMVVEDKMVLGSNLQEKKHIRNDATSSRDVVLLISGIATETRKMEVQINGSAIVGRASICDIYFDDPSMSRQHFALEVDNNELYISDLDSKWGTYVDDSKITERTRLQNGSEIKAGSVSLVIRW